MGDRSDLGGQGALPRGGWLSDRQDTRGGSDNWLPASPPRHSMAASTSNAAPRLARFGREAVPVHYSEDAPNMATGQFGGGGDAAPVVTSQAQVRLDCHPSQHKLLQACEHGSLDAYIIQHTCFALLHTSSRCCLCLTGLSSNLPNPE